MGLVFFSLVRGSVLDEAVGSAGRTPFRRALAAEPFNLRALYNLADTLDEMGRVDDARAHWQTYLRGDPRSDRADYARSRLA